MKAPTITLVLTLALLFALPAATDARSRKPAVDKKAEAAVTALVECAADPAGACVRDCIEKVEAAGGKACPLLAGRFAESEEAVQLLLAQGLTALKCPELTKVAETAFNNADADNRGPLAVIFAQSKDEGLVAPISALVKSGRPFDREKGCEALAMLGRPEAVPAIVDATRHALFSVRLQAAQALASFPDETARAALCGLLAADKNTGVRVKAAESLGRHKQKEAVPCMIAGLEDESGAVKTATHRALIEAAGLDIGMDPEAWTKWWEKNKPTKRR
jgi:HEAT repeat protein